MESEIKSTVERGYAARVGTALLLIRIAAASAFVYHGGAILFGWFGGPGPAQFGVSTHLGTTVGVLVGLAQFCGGLAVLTGLLARLGAACIAVVMLGAILLVHLPHGFDVTKGGIEYAWVQLLIAVAITVAGPGPYSLQSLVRGRLGAGRGRTVRGDAPPASQ